MSRILAIDFGTTNCRAAVIKAGKPILIENSEGLRTTPSVVAFTKTGERLIGGAAARQAAVNPENTIFSIKRFLGRRFDEVQQEAKQVRYKVVKASNGAAHVQVGSGASERTYSPPEIVAMILTRVKADAEAKLGEAMTEAVIAVPVCFDNSQRKATLDASRIAGFDSARLISAPLAAALAYGHAGQKREKIAVCNLGGGTFDFAIVETGDGAFDARAVNGDTHLGGDDWNGRIVDWIVKKFASEQHINLKEQPAALQRLWEAAEAAKLALSASTTHEIILPFITTTAAGPMFIYDKISRGEFDGLTTDLAERIAGSIRACLKDAELGAKEIDGLVLVGGSTRMPKVAETIRKALGKEPRSGTNSEETVVVGAAMLAAYKTGELNNALILDVTPLTLAIETAGGVASPMIPRNSTLPTRKAQIFSTYANNQRAVEINVLEGERPRAKENKLLGVFHLDNIPPAPSGKPRIEVVFDLNMDGVLNVSAKDLDTSRDQIVAVLSTDGLTKDEVEKMRRAAAKEIKPAQKTEESELRNHAEVFAYACEKQVKDLQDEISEPRKETIRTSIVDLRTALKNGDDTEVARVYEKLQNDFQPISEELSHHGSVPAKSGDQENAKLGAIDNAASKNPAAAKSAASRSAAPADTSSLDRARPLRMFVSYSHADETFKDLLLVHLSPLRDSGMIEPWNDRDIVPGERWAEMIATSLGTADLILLLVSPNFLASNYCSKVEMKKALERESRNEAIVVPIIIRPCYWDHASFNHLQALPTNAKPVTKWEDRDEAWLDASKGLVRVITKWRAGR